MDMTVVVAIIGAIEAVGVTIIGGLISRNNKKNDEYRNLREERDTNIYGLMFATANGTEVLLEAAHGDQLNGNVDEALTRIRVAKGKCNGIANKNMARL